MCKASIEYSLERAILNLCNLREFEPPHGFACMSVPSPQRPRKNKVHHIVLRLISLRRSGEKNQAAAPFNPNEHAICVAPPSTRHPVGRLGAVVSVKFRIVVSLGMLSTDGALTARPERKEPETIRHRHS